MASIASSGSNGTPDLRYNDQIERHIKHVRDLSADGNAAALADAVICLEDYEFLKRLASIMGISTKSRTTR
jgi:hypothetical protein